MPLFEPWLALFSQPGVRQPPPIRGVGWGLALLLHPPNRQFPDASRAAQHQAAAPKAAVDLIHGLHQADTVFGHVGFGVFVAGAVDVFQDGAGRLGDVGAVAGGAGQGDARAAAVLGVFFSEGAGADEGHQVAGVAVLPAQFFRRTACEFGDGFLQFDQFRDRVAE